MALEFPLDYRGPAGRPFAAWPRQHLDQPVFARFAAFASTQPDQPAVIEAERSWTYQDIYQLALQVAAAVAQASPDPVAVLLPIGGSLAAAFLGLLAAGRPYVPIDPSFPAARNRLILEQAGVTCAISDLSLQQAAAAWLGQLPIIDIHALPTRPASRLAGQADSIAYILYTSGSTGQPKGIYQNQRGLLHDVYQYSHAIHLSPDDRLTSLYSPSVNGAIRDIYGALLNGAALVGIPVQTTGLAGLSALVAQYGISVFHAIPPLLRAFLHSSPPAQDLVSVRLAYLAGDRCFASDVAEFYRHFPDDCLIYNGIGSSECATLYRHWFINRQQHFDTALIPVGYAIAERDTWLRGADGQPVSPGEIGEVVISSPFIAQGYWRNPALSREKFYGHPERPGWRCFVSGDLARERPDGLLEFVGRNDRQVKIRGHRVELDAIEAELRQIPGIQDLALVVVGTAESPELAAWLVGTTLPTDILRARLQAKLPAAFIPAHIHWLPELPRLPNHKADLAALQQLVPVKPIAAPPNAPQTLAEQLAHCWMQVLRLNPPLNPAQSFADQGGDSLTALMVLVRMETILQRRLPRDLLQSQQTFAGLLQAVLAPAAAEATLYVIMADGDAYPHWLAFAEHLPNTVALDTLTLPSGEATIIQQADYISSHIRTRANTQPQHLLGFSRTALAAFTAACQLNGSGQPIQSLIMADIAEPSSNDNWQPGYFSGPLTVLAPRTPDTAKRWDWAASAQTINVLPIDCGTGQLLGIAAAAHVRQALLVAMGMVDAPIRRHIRKAF
ncbi:AMP-binding protein [Methylovulum psychrotolerans]|uniref:Non-ribosomal peptide synthetase n=1 Tax=Methylovulum psychrotolerans TaxID=1704499 RepID=A0A2S5CNF6_9GAMM|nr:AMP-binding protein [Methylovulum psychrotolerans]POZ52324.1 non-ribosomal peptide synthetase [Methylovulum psychrotolerans]